jgi:NADPH-dependent 7-cyano-7-deazaguanine reductase QueF
LPVKQAVQKSVGLPRLQAWRQCEVFQAVRFNKITNFLYRLLRPDKFTLAGYVDTVEAWALTGGELILT